MGRKVLEPYPIFFGMYKWRSTFKIQNFITFYQQYVLITFCPFVLYKQKKDTDRGKFTVKERNKKKNKPTFDTSRKSRERAIFSTSLS